MTDEAPSWFSPVLSLPAGSNLRRIGWTFNRPAELPGDYAGVELADTAGTSYLWDGSRCPSAAPDRQTWDVRRKPPSAFRARIVFLRKTPVDANTPILDSPTFDDLTLVYEPSGGPRILSWGP